MFTHAHTNARKPHPLPNVVSGYSLAARRRNNTAVWDERWSTMGGPLAHLCNWLHAGPETITRYVITVTTSYRHDCECLTPDLEDYSEATEIRDTLNTVHYGMNEWLIQMLEPTETVENFRSAAKYILSDSEAHLGKHSHMTGLQKAAVGKLQ